MKVEPWMKDSRVVAFMDHVRAEHDGAHDLPCRVCDRLWSRIDFGWRRQPERKPRVRHAA